MSCGTVTPPIQRSLTALAGGVQYEWYTEWMLLPGLDLVTIVLKNKGVSGSFRSQTAMQLAAVRTDNPSAPSLIGNAQTGAGERADLSIDVATGNTGYFYVRFGVGYDLSEGSTLARADVELLVSFNACGKIAGAINQQLVATSTTVSYMAVTPFLPTIVAAKVRAAIAAASLTGDFQWRLAYRTAATNVQNPDAWSTTFDTYHTAGELNTGDLTPTISGKMWIQLGIQFNLSSSTPGQASISGAVAVVK